VRHEAGVFTIDGLWDCQGLHLVFGFVRVLAEHVGIDVVSSCHFCKQGLGLREFLCGCLGIPLGLLFLVLGFDSTLSLVFQLQSHSL